MLDGWERVIKVMQQAPPSLVLGRLPEGDRVILQALPTNQQDISIGGLKAVAQFVGKIPGYGGDDC